MKQLLSRSLFLCLFILSYIHVGAQCPLDNNVFQAGESLDYDLYFKYGIIYKKAGVAKLNLDNHSYKGTDGYRMQLTARSTGLIKSFFSLSDTLTSYSTRDFSPLAYTKDAHEDGDYSTERASFQYDSDKTNLRMISVRNGKLRYDTTFVSNNCMYDVVSILYYARTIDYSTMKKGDRRTVSFFAGRKMMNMDIEHQGIETVSANDGRKYYCIKLSLIGSAAAFEDKNEAMKIYLTDDMNKIPVRIESKLKIGSARVVLRGYKGQKY
ncbi:DUF3108 domain-containing protein [Bacteroides sp. OttesenSCG-928-D19]|nr:DUF3108 domain-containing protein [Bacteroides sp. OttesenSCG-928-D19]